MRFFKWGLAGLLVLGTSCNSSSNERHQPAASGVEYQDGDKVADLPPAKNVNIPRDWSMLGIGRQKDQTLGLVFHSGAEKQVVTSSDLGLHPRSTSHNSVPVGRFGMVLEGTFFDPSLENVTGNEAKVDASFFVYLNKNSQLMTMSYKNLGEAEPVGVRAAVYDQGNRLYFSFGKALHYWDLQTLAIYKAKDDDYHVSNIYRLNDGKLIVSAKEWNSQLKERFYEVLPNLTYRKISDSTDLRFEDPLLTVKGRRMYSQAQQPDRFLPFVFGRSVSIRGGAKYVFSDLRPDVNHYSWRDFGAALVDFEDESVNMGFERRLSPDLAFGKGRVVRPSFDGGVWRIDNHPGLFYEPEQNVFSSLSGVYDGWTDRWVGLREQDETIEVAMLNLDGSVQKIYSAPLEKRRPNRVIKLGTRQFLISNPRQVDEIVFGEQEMQLSEVQESNHYMSVLRGENSFVVEGDQLFFARFGSDKLRIFRMGADFVAHEERSIPISECYRGGEASIYKVGGKWIIPNKIRDREGCANRGKLHLYVFDTESIRHMDSSNLKTYVVNDTESDSTWTLSCFANDGVFCFHRADQDLFAFPVGDQLEIKPEPLDHRNLRFGGITPIPGLPDGNPLQMYPLNDDRFMLYQRLKTGNYSFYRFDANTDKLEPIAELTDLPKIQISSNGRRHGLLYTKDEVVKLALVDEQGHLHFMDAHPDVAYYSAVVF